MNELEKIQKEKEDLFLQIYEHSNFSLGEMRLINYVCNLLIMIYKRVLRNGNIKS